VSNILYIKSNSKTQHSVTPEYNMFTLDQNLSHPNYKSFKKDAYRLYNIK
jgi:hypothetical protein